MKTIQTFDNEGEDYDDTHLAIVKAGIDQVISTIPDSAFTGLITKAHLGITASSCWEKTRSEDGTVAAIHDIVDGYKDGVPVPTTNFETGINDGSVTKDTANIGTYIFYACLSYVRTTPLEEISSVMLVSAEEPGKARSVTKGMAAAKIVLDVINKMCSWPLKRGLETSVSGMGKANHAWNFFREFFRHSEDVFEVDESTPPLQEFVDHDIITHVYKTVFASSTDYKTATDFLDFKVGKILGVTWMRRCGIPSLLIGIVVAICYNPRNIYFHASGPLNRFGKPTDDARVRFITSKRGILMGDPLTKIVLHLTNAVSRSIAEHLGRDPAFLRNYVINNSEVLDFFQNKGS